MNNIFVGGIVLFAGNFAPRGWQFCNGQILPIAQNQALFSLLGTTYGGNGVSTFALPDLRGRTPVGPGQGPGLSNYVLGEQTGVETVTLITTQIPGHVHQLLAATTPADQTSPQGNISGVVNDPTSGTAFPAYIAVAKADAAMNPTAPTGGNQPHTNLQPLLVLNYIIALTGIFPSRN